MDVRERILAAMSWQEPDRVPLTIYDWMLPTGAAERELREMGLGIITRLPAHQVEHATPGETRRDHQAMGTGHSG